MQRRSGSGKPTKVQRGGPKARKALTAHASAADLQDQLDRRTRELEEALQYQTATSEVLSIIRRSPADAQPVFDAIVQSAVRLCGAIFGVVYLYDGDRVRIAATNNFTPAATNQMLELQQLKRPERTHLGGRAILDCKVTHVHDVLADPEYSRELALAGGWRAVLSVPLLHDGEPVGALSVAKAEAMQFSYRQIQVLNTFAAQDLIAIENVRLFGAEQARTRELSEALEQQTATSEVLKAISSSPGELEPVFNAMLANATRICETPFGNLFLREGPIFRAVAVHNKKSYNDYLRRNSLVDLRANPGVPLDRVARSKQVVHIPDLRTDQSYLGRNAFVVPVVEIVGARTFVSVPMLKHGELIGAINMYRQEVRPFTDKQIDLVKNFAAQAVIAIENARLLNELRQRTDDLTESLEQQTATSEVLKVVSSSPGELQQVFDTMLANATRLCGASYGAMWLRDGDGFRNAALHGPLPPEYVEQITRLLVHPGPDGVLTQLVQTRKPVHVPDLRDSRAHLYRDTLPVAAVEVAGVRTIVSVPMFKADEVIGAITIYRKEIRPFTDKQIELVKNFAAQAVITIEKGRLLNDLRESLQQQTATSEILEVISNSPTDSQPAFDAIVRSGLKLFPDAAIMVALPDGNLMTGPAIVAADPADVEVLRARFPIPLSREFISSTAILDRREIDLPDARDAPTALSAGARNFLASGYRAMTIMPMMRGESAIGTLNVMRRRPGPLSDKQRGLLRTFASQAVIAIENTRLFNELRESLQQQTATADVLKVISSSPGDLEPVFDTMLANATGL